MEKLGLNELREKFLAYFESKGHYRLKSAPLVPQNDRSLLLINSGMAPLKPFFTGEIEPPAPRVTTCQKCIRTPDIESVGKDSRHGTYFEMLGNFSFGDYFKREASAWAWEFVKDVVKLPLDRVYISVFYEDDEAWDIWTKEIGVAEDHMVRLGRADNFWEHGVGPCGPCSEIYFDRGEKYGCDNPNCAPGCDCDRYVEFWNLVFTQFSSDGKGVYTPLARKNIDTGMGLERLACIVQEAGSLFEVDTMINITNHVSRITGARYGQSAKTDVSLRIITDHIRSTAMMVCDGVIPSNEGRGYVLRRLLRRAARHGRLLGVERPFLYEVCDTVIRENEGAYPELREKQDYIKKLIQVEEERFCATIESGLVMLDQLIAQRKANGEKTLGSDDAFRLYDTYGFPIDLTMEIVEENGLTVDRADFDRLMREQRERARAARGEASALAWGSEQMSLSELPATRFLGYDTLACAGRVLAAVCEDEFVGTLSAGQKATVIADCTPMYAESGGQMADHGIITGKTGVFTVYDVKKTADGKFLHVGELTQGTLSVPEDVTLTVDSARRSSLMRAHSATHLLQKALRTVLGGHVEQSGSLVEPDKLRFDFTHFAALTGEELTRVEEIVNEAILEGLAIDTREMPISEAKKLGATALFGEKYGDVVRVVTMGDFSVELCGGTHAGNTARIGAFKITSEASIAAGVRRIEAYVGKGVLRLVHELEHTLADASQALKTTPADLGRKVTQTMTDMRELNRQNETLRDKLSALRAVELLNFAKAEGGVRVLAMKVEDMSADALRSLSDSIRDRAPDMVCVLATVTADGKVQFAAACGKDAVQKGAHAGNLVRELAKMTGGGGGGRPDSATAGGKEPEKLEAALEAVNNLVSLMLK